MAREETRYISQSVDYLGFLEAKLRDLQGIATLTYELIQNADDVLDDEGQSGASQIIFDIQDDALVVENDGVFRPIDFKRMQNVASGDKRKEAGTTGAFGIGFIAVYQITDRPELFSSGKRWIFRPEQPEHCRIEEQSVKTAGTRFRLPWASDGRTKVRRQLRQKPVKKHQLPVLETEMAEAISLAALFLKNLTVLELRRSGRVIKRVERRIVGYSRIVLKEDGGEFEWRTFRGNYQDQANRLRSQHRLQIEAKRQSQVWLAITQEPMRTGRLFAVLPSETTIPLPFHISADFYPTSDRKRIIFGDDYQSEWNRAAVRAAAGALVNNMNKLPKLLGPTSLWHLIQSLNHCKHQPDAHGCDTVFGSFWDALAPTLPNRAYVYTTRGRWVVPGVARLLKSKAEQDASSILASLGIPIVHPDLRPYFGLLRQKEIGTPLLSVQDIVSPLLRAGLDKRVPLSKAPAQLRNRKNWGVLWRTLDALLEHRRSAQEQAEVIRRLKTCAIALGADGALWRPDALLRADTETRELFAGVPWLHEHVSPDQVPGHLVSEFTVEKAIDFLSQLPASKLQAAQRKGGLQVDALYRWFEARKADVLRSPELKERLCGLVIWPVSGRLQSLENLYIPGGFDDPLNLSALIDLKALGGRKEFLKDLGVQELNFETYVREQVPRVLEEQPDLPTKARRRLVQLLAQRLGEIREHPDLSDCLGQLPLVACTDGAFRAAREVYAPTEVVGILGSSVYVAAAVKQNAEAVEAFYEWLGVAQEPRPKDVVLHLQELAARPPDKRTHKTVETVFEFLVGRWSKWEVPQRRAYSPLQNLAWLPGNAGAARWYQPSEVYAVFRAYLFETQAVFLDLPAPLQRAAGGSEGLIEFLGIKVDPAPVLVVHHLRAFSERRVRLKGGNEVYRFLNDNAHDASLDQLKGTACLLLPDEQEVLYVRAYQVFWNEHPFGRFRHQLGSELRVYNAFFERLGVREQPNDSDYVQVMLDIWEQYGQSHTPLDEETHEVVMRCWEALSAALEAGRIRPEDLANLQGKEVIPDPRPLLAKPQNLFFEDRAGLAAKFQGFLENSVIVRPQGAWRAIEAVGVRRLSQAVKVHLLECGNVTEDRFLAGRVKQRAQLIGRVIESEKAAGAEDLDPDALRDLGFQRVQPLVIQYELQAFRRRCTTEPESVPALLMTGENTLLTVRDGGRIPWPAVARELAYAVKPVGEIGGLAGGLKEALAGRSLKSACRTLGELGYPPLQQRVEGQVTSAGPISDLGGDEPSAEEAVAAILGDDGAERTKMPDTPPEIVRSVGTRKGDGDGAGRSADVRPGPSRTPTTKRKSQGRLRSYVVPEGAELEGGPDRKAAQRRTKVDDYGIRHVLKHERHRGRRPKRMPHHNEGYDVKSLDEDGQERLIEVKSLSGDWGTWSAAGLTKTQFEMAREKGEQFWLYVVERATNDDYQIHCIQDPAHKVDQYLFDDGWQALAGDERGDKGES